MNPTTSKKKILFSFSSWSRNSTPEWIDRCLATLVFFCLPLWIFYLQMANLEENFWLQTKFLLLEFLRTNFTSKIFTIKVAIELLRTKFLLLEIFTQFLFFFKKNFTSLPLYWIGFQLILALLPERIGKALPSFFGAKYLGGRRSGSPTPAGLTHDYQINGLQAWILSHFLFLFGAYLGYWKLSYIAENWFSLFLSANLIGYALTFLLYFKALIWPSFPEENRQSGYFLYDLVMGIELNPRIFNFDLKLFFNGRPGIIAWTMINLSFMAEQYRRFGTISNAMIILNFLQGLYVLDFFWNENWYLHTLDVTHDRFGWMLAWGDCVWLPFIYTLQGTYLSRHQVELSFERMLLVLSLGLGGYLLFRWSNYQRNYFRRTEGRGLIWDRHPDFLICSYETQKGRHRSLLLHSGFWGWARHLNYTGDLLLSLAYCLTCPLPGDRCEQIGCKKQEGYTFIPYFYFFYMVILLVIRCYRDEDRCLAKYGEKWKQYCQIVPYRFIPYLY